MNSESLGACRRKILLSKAETSPNNSENHPRILTARIWLETGLKRETTLEQLTGLKTAIGSGPVDSGPGSSQVGRVKM